METCALPTILAAAASTFRAEPFYTNVRMTGVRMVN